MKPRKTAPGRPHASASRADNFSEIDFREMADPAQVEQAHAVARDWQDHAHPARRHLARARYRLTSGEPSTAISAMRVPIRLVRRSARKAAALIVLLTPPLDEHVYRVFLRFIHAC